MITDEKVISKIYLARGQKIMLDRDLADAIYLTKLTLIPGIGATGKPGLSNQFKY